MWPFPPPFLDYVIETEKIRSTYIVLSLAKDNVYLATHVRMIQMVDVTAITSH